MKKITKTLMFLLMIVFTFTLFACEEVELTSINMPSEVTAQAVADGKVELSELKLVATYSDKSNKEIPLTQDMVSAEELAKLSEPGEYKLTFTYEGKKVEVTFVIPGKKISKLEVKAESLSNALLKETFDYKDLILVVTFEDSTSEEVQVTEEMLDENEAKKISLPGKQTIKLVYKSKEATFELNNKGALASISIDSESLEAAKLANDYSLVKVVLTYENKETELVSLTEEMLTEAEKAKLEQAGKQTIVVKYAEKETSFEVNVKGKVTSAKINDASVTAALAAKPFDYTTILLDVVYENGEKGKLNLCADFFDEEQLNKFNYSGKQNISITVDEVKVDFSLRMPVPTGTLAKIELLPESIEKAYAGELFDYNKLVLLFTYSSGETCYSKIALRMLSEADLISLYTKGTHEITFTYGGISSKVTINVAEDKLIELSQLSEIADGTQIVVKAYVTYACGTTLYVYSKDAALYATAENTNKLTAVKDLLVKGNEVLFSCVKSTTNEEISLSKISGIVGTGNKDESQTSLISDYKTLENNTYKYVSLANAKVAVKPDTVLNANANVTFEVTNGTDTVTIRLPKDEDNTFSQKLFITLSELAVSHEMTLDNLLVINEEGKLYLNITQDSIVEYTKVEHEYQRPEEGTPNAEFDVLLEELFLEFLGESPFNLNYSILDIKAFDEKHGTDLANAKVIPSSIDDMSPEYELEYFEELKAQIAKIKAFDRNTLSTSQKLTYDVVLDNLERSMNYLELNEDGENIYFYYGTQLGSYLGYQAQLPSIIADYRFDDKLDIDNYLEYLRTVQYDFEALYSFELVKCTAKDAIPLSDYVIDKIIEQCDNFINTDEENYLITVFNDRIGTYDFLTPEEVEAYKVKNATYINTYFIEAYRWLKGKLIELKAANNQANANDTLTGALSNTENGKKYYEVKFQDACGSDLTIPELIKYIDAKLAEYDELKAIYPAYDGNLMEEAGLIKYNEKGEIDYYESLYSVLPFLMEATKEDFPSLPYELILNQNYTINEIPEALKENSSPAYYLSSPMDAGANIKELIYINPKDFSEVGSYMFQTLAHEGYPGHLYQNAFYKTVHEPNIRNTISYTGYSEGWANYVENYVGKYVLENYGMLQMLLLDPIASLNNCRMDIGVNYEGWGVEDIIKQYGLTMDDVNSGKYTWTSGDVVSYDDFEDVYYFYVEVPTNYLMYFFSCAQLQDIKAEFKDEMGVYYSDKLFHTIYLETGDASWPVIKQAFEDYAALWGTNGTNR